MSIQTKPEQEEGALPQNADAHIEGLVKAVLYLVRSGAGHAHDERVETLHGALLDVIAEHVLKDPQCPAQMSLTALPVSTRRH